MTRLWMSYSLKILFVSTDWGEKKDFFADFLRKKAYICTMKKSQKNTLLLTPVHPVKRKMILDSMVASFKIEGITIPQTRVEAIFARVNEKLKKYPV